jgi:hypothetical protein
MKSAIPRSAPGSEFDEFLFTPIGEDRNGLPLSVLSLFARMNLDPWQEAADLAALSLEAAAGRLALCLEALTDPILRRASSRESVGRLLRLLPPRQPIVHTAAVGAGAVAAPDSASRIRTILFITSAIVLVGSQLLGAHRYPPPAAVAGPNVPAASSQVPVPPGH